MKLKSIVPPFICTLLCLFVFSCTKDTEDNDPFFLPNFSNTWTSENNHNPGSQYFFNDTIQDGTKGTGGFNGFENVNGDSWNLNGGYQYRNIQVHILTKAENGGVDNGPDAGLTFKGLLDTTHPQQQVMRLVNTADKKDSLVLLQHN